MTLCGDLTFLSPPGEVADWRMTLLVDAAAACGLLAALPGTAPDLSEELHLDSHAVRVVLDALSVFGVAERDGEGRWSAGASAPGPAQVAMLRHHARALRRWSADLEPRLRGAPDAEARAPMAEPEVFMDALGAGARAAAPGLVDLCLQRFPAARSVLDLGGLHGEYSLEFRRRGLRATMQDLPPMIEIARSRGDLAAAGVELFSGSFFEAVPPGPFDLAFCSGITHTFDGEHNRALYRRLRPVISADGGIAVVSFLRGRAPLADVFAVQMLLNASGGDTHSEEEYRDWLTQAGFTVDDSVVDLPGRPQSVLFAG